MAKSNAAIRLKGAILPKDLGSLIGRQVYFRLGKGKTSISNTMTLTPLKLYTILNVSGKTTLKDGGYGVLATIKLDNGRVSSIILGNLTCGHLDDNYYWSLKQLPAAAVIEE